VVFPIGISPELSSQVVIGLVLWVLEIVFAVGRCLPDIDDCIWDSLASEEIGHLAVHERWVSAWGGVLNDAASELAEWGVWGPEGAKDGGGGGIVAVFAQKLVGNFVDESADVNVSNLKVVRNWNREAYDSRPITSDILWPSFLLESEICPIELMKLTPIIHSSTLSSTSRAKS
jgi:hypothetical protein